MNSVRNTEVVPKFGDAAIKFAQQLIRIKSYSGQEQEIALFIRDTMKRLGFAVIIDQMGNVIGKIGEGNRCLLFDSHMDTVETNETEWQHPPFEGVIENGRLYGLGSADMKSSAAASIYAAAAAQRLGLCGGKSVYVVCSVCEETCDGENLKFIFENDRIAPDCVVICEPSDNMIMCGHNGKVMTEIITEGIQSHGSMPEEGRNAVYDMADIIKRVEKLNTNLVQRGKRYGTIVLSDISCFSPSLNSVPSRCRILLDRRIGNAVSAEDVKAELDELVAQTSAWWGIKEIRMLSWTGHEICYLPIHNAWSIPVEHPLIRAASDAFRRAFDKSPEYGLWNGSTNAVASIAKNIPTFGLGPGCEKIAHMRDEYCETEKIKEATAFYTEFIGIF